MKTIIILTAFLLCSFAPSQRWELLKNISNKKVGIFINNIYEDALKIHESTGVPLAIIIGQSCLETGYGSSKLCRNNCNYFGVRRNHKYMIYDSKEDSFSDYGKVMCQKCYSSLNPKSLGEWYNALVSCGYAESKEYIWKLKSIIKKYGLDKLK